MAEVMGTPITNLSPLMHSGGADAAGSGLAVNAEDANSRDDSFAQQLQAVHEELDPEQPGSNAELDESPESTTAPEATIDADERLDGQDAMASATGEHPATKVDSAALNCDEQAAASSSAVPESPALVLAVPSVSSESAPKASSQTDLNASDAQQQQVLLNTTGSGPINELAATGPNSPDLTQIDSTQIDPKFLDLIDADTKVPVSIDGVLSQATGALVEAADYLPTDNVSNDLAGALNPLVNTSSANTSSDREISEKPGGTAGLRAQPTTVIESSQAAGVQTTKAVSDPLAVTGQTVVFPSELVLANGYMGASITGAELFASRTARSVAAHSVATAVETAEAVEFATPNGVDSVRTRLEPGLFGVRSAINAEAIGTPPTPQLTASDETGFGQSTGVAVEAELVDTKAALQSMRTATESPTGVSLRIQNASDNVANLNPENMFHATASGIVTAPTGLKPDTGTGASIFAPQNVPLLTDEADEALSSNVRWMANESIRQAVVKVTPSGMGPISIQLDVESEQMSVSIVAVQGVTREALDAMLPRLREQIVAQGYENVNVNVSDSHPDQSLQRDNSSQSADSDARDKSNSESTIADVSADDERAMRPDRHRGLFDVYV